MNKLFTVYTRKSLEKNGADYVHPVINKGRFQTEEQAQALADIITASGAWAIVGTFYTFTREEFSRDPYKCIIDGQRCTIVAGKKGSTLIFENLHFSII